MRSRIPSSLALTRALALTGAFALGVASSAQAVAISGLTVSLDAGNTANLFDDIGANAAQISSSVAVTSSTATSFVTRYQAGVYADAGGNGAVTDTATLNASYTITFNVTNAAGEVWRLDLVTSRIGSRTAVDDGQGSSAFSLSAVTGFLGGSGTLSSGSLGLAAIANSQQSTALDSPFGAGAPFNQSGTASISGSGNGTVTLRFTFSATSQTIVQGNGNNAQGDEAAIRMGIPATLSQFTAGNYPGPGNRTAANDGHFVDLDLFDLGPVPEPDTALMLTFGLAVLAIQGRSRRRPS
ncbi:MAG TPA: PEP-CTERM sorting domain-containing protein [Myxococcota bacterium]|nr:PEP-CTERM sorting domain-containing protein [Myxococcota bacterium]